MSGSRRLGRQHAFVILVQYRLGTDNVDKAIRQTFWTSTELTEDLDPDEKALVQRQVKAFREGVC